MTDAINAAVNAATNASSVSSSLTNGAITATSKQELAALKIDTTKIKTEVAAKIAIKAAQKKLELKGTEETGESKQVEDIEDTVQLSKVAKDASKM